jgi:hypothetical protein
MAEFRPYSDLPMGVHPLLHTLIDEHHDLIAMAILPGGEKSIKITREIETTQFNDFDWAQFVFCDLKNREEIRGFICSNKVCLVLAKSDHRGGGRRSGILKPGLADRPAPRFSWGRSSF